MKISLLSYVQAKIRNSFWRTVVKTNQLRNDTLAVLQLFSSDPLLFPGFLKVNVPDPDLCVILQGFFTVWINSRDLEPWREKHIWEPLRKALRFVLLSWMWSRVVPKSPQEKQTWFMCYQGDCKPNLQVSTCCTMEISNNLMIFVGFPWNGNKEQRLHKQSRIKGRSGPLCCAPEFKAPVKLSRLLCTAEDAHRSESSRKLKSWIMPGEGDSVQSTQGN